jgi:hypothetical protein
MLTKTAATALAGGIAVLFAGCGKATIGGEKVAAAEKSKAGGHLVNLFGGSGVHWTDVWKGFGALEGDYVFTALASRALARQRTSIHASGEADRQSMVSPSR